MAKLNFAPLFKQLVERKLPKMEFCAMSGVSSTTLARMNRDEPVGLDVVVRICAALKCPIQDVVTVELVGE